MFYFIPLYYLQKHNSGKKPRLLVSTYSLDYRLNIKYWVKSSTKKNETYFFFYNFAWQSFGDAPTTNYTILIPSLRAPLPRTWHLFLGTQARPNVAKVQKSKQTAELRARITAYMTLLYFFSWPSKRNCRQWDFLSEEDEEKILNIHYHTMASILAQS